MNRMIDIHQTHDGDPLTFAVTVRDAGGESRHIVTLTAAQAKSLAQEPVRIVEAALRFLLDREPKESILPRFDLSVIERYFPEFPRKLLEYL